MEEMTAVLRQTPTGWLAVSTEYPRIGVPGTTEDEARDALRDARQLWLAAHA